MADRPCMYFCEIEADSRYGPSTSYADIVACPAVVKRIASFLPPNEVACSLRCVSRLTADQLRQHGNGVVRLSQPCPTWAFAARWSAPGACLALSYKRRLQLLCLTAASGDVANLEAALAASGLCMTGELMAAAAAAGHLHVCRWLAKRGCPLDSRKPLLASAAASGDAELCEWLLDLGCAWDQACVLAAARGGHVALMESLRSKAPAGPGGKVSGRRLFKAAAEGCDLPTVQALWGQGPREERERYTWLCEAAPAAARSPTPDWAAKVAWLLEQGAAHAQVICISAASCPDGVARLTLLTGDMGLPTCGLAFTAAARLGRIDSLRWLLARGERPVNAAPAVLAAQEGRTEVLKALHAFRCELPPPSELLVAACGSGSVETAGWVLQAFWPEALQGAGSAAYGAALRSGSLELVSLLHSLWPAPGPAPCWGSAAEGGCVEVLEWLRERDAAVQDPSLSSGQPYVRAAAHGDLLALEALRRLGLPLGAGAEARGEALRASVAAGAPLEARRWLWDAQGQEAQALARAEAEAERAARAQAVAQAGPALAPVAEAEYDSGSDSDDDEEEDWAAEALAQAEAEAEAQAKSHAGAVAFVVVTAKGKGKAEAAKPGKGDGEGKAKGKGRAYVVRNWLRSRVQRALRALETA